MIDNLFTRDQIADAMARDDWQTRAMLRAVCRQSLFFYTKVVTCYHETPNLFDVGVFKESCDWLQYVVETLKRGLFEDPRGHAKTTRTADAIPDWIAIQRPDERYDFAPEIARAEAYLVAHPHIRGVDSRIVIASDSKERATIFTRTGPVRWETNALQRWLFPELLWDNPNTRSYGSWSDGAWSLPGRRNPSLKDDFVRAVGIESKEQGGRAEILLIDDLVGEQSVNSITEINRRRNWLRTIGSLLENRDYRHPAGGVILLTENRWSLDDVNSMVHTEYADWAIWRRSSYRCYVHGTGNCGRWGSDEIVECADTDEPLWKGRYPDAASLERVRQEMGDEAFNAQMRNDPSQSAELVETGFKSFAIDVATIEVADGKTREWCAIVAPPKVEGVTAKPEVVPLRALTAHLLSIDPASSKEKGACRTAISWFAYDRPTGRVFWLDCRADRWSPDESVDAAYRLWCEIHDLLGIEPRILIEKVAAQGFMAAALKFRALSDREHPRRLPECEMIPPLHGDAKDDRIRRRLGSRLNQGLLMLRSGLQLPRTEVRHFPTGSKDTLDTEVQAEEIFLELQPSHSGGALAAARRRRHRRRIAASGVTGVPL